MNDREIIEKLAEEGSREWGHYEATSDLLERAISMSHTEAYLTQSKMHQCDYLTTLPERGAIAERSLADGARKVLERYKEHLTQNYGRGWGPEWDIADVTQALIQELEK